MEFRLVYQGAFPSVGAIAQKQAIRETSSSPIGRTLETRGLFSRWVRRGAISGREVPSPLSLFPMGEFNFVPVGLKGVERR